MFLSSNKIGSKQEEIIKDTMSKLVEKYETLNFKGVIDANAQDSLYTVTELVCLSAITDVGLKMGLVQFH